MGVGAVEDLYAKLRQVSLFEALSDEELAGIIQMGKEARFAAGKEVTTEGATGVGFHLILEGRAAVTVGGKQRRTLVSSEYFGEMALLDGEARSATVTALTDLRTYSLASWDFMGLVDTEPRIARKIFVALSRRIRGLEGSETA
jgi:CRP/FNR family transcriptional regulator, cyclic AMP receptor protein